MDTEPEKDSKNEYIFSIKNNQKLFFWHHKDFSNPTHNFSVKKFTEQTVYEIVCKYYNIFKETIPIKNKQLSEVVCFYF